MKKILQYLLVFAILFIGYKLLTTKSISPEVISNPIETKPPSIEIIEIFKDGNYLKAEVKNKSSEKVVALVEFTVRKNGNLVSSGIGTATIAPNSTAIADRYFIDSQIPSGFTWSAKIVN